MTRHDQSAATVAETDQQRLKRERALVRGLPTEYLQCRMMRHAGWVRFVPDRSRIKVRWGTPVGWRCGSCGTERIDVIDSRGQLSWRSYTYPDGYTLPGGRPPSIEVVRVEWLRRLKGGTRRVLKQLG